jgi:hypothetical protein
LGSISFVGRRRNLASLNLIVRRIKVAKLLHRVFSFCIVTAVLIACVQTPVSKQLRIDSSTSETFQSSWDRLRGSLTQQQQSQLDLAILPIALGKYKSFVDVPPSLLAGIGPQNIRSDVDGMSFTEILDLAKKQPIKVQLPRQ